MPPFVIIIIILAVGIGIYLAWQADKKRREKLMVWATQRGWSMRPGGHGGMDKDFPGLKILTIAYTSMVISNCRTLCVMSCSSTTTAAKL